MAQKLNEQMAKVALSIGKVRMTASEEQKIAIDEIIKEISANTFGSHSRFQIHKFAQVTGYKQEFFKKVREAIEVKNG